MASGNEAVLIRGELANIFAGAFFLFIALLAFGIAATRPRGGTRMLIWLGIWSGMFGANDLLGSRTIAASLPVWFEPWRQLLAVCFAYLIVVAAMMAFRELTLGSLKRLLQVQVIAALVVAALAITWFLRYGSETRFILYNQLIAVIVLVVLVITLLVPKLSRKYLVLSQHKVLTVGTLVFSAEALAENLARPLNFTLPQTFGTVGFALLLLSFGYTAIEMVLTNEQRLLSIDRELEIARKLQFSILPERTPEIANLRIAATYLPMTAVAGDFYEFLPMDEHRAGFLVADVSGHGVPAALIASMMKVASGAVNGCASRPAEVLEKIGGSLSHHLRGQFVSAAYLWMDTAERKARYSAAGHPPLLRWNAAEEKLSKIESNGLLFGVGFATEYPVFDFAIARGDRLILYTDGVTETENAAGEQFGDKRLEQIVREHHELTASQLSARLIEESRAWQPDSMSQQDDVTLIVIDVL